ncbi:hypothetical protein H5410_013317, partial [Solanum commersonii]
KKNWDTLPLNRRFSRRLMSGRKKRRSCVGGGKSRMNFCVEGIGLSHQAEALDGVQITAMSAQITKLTAALANLERRRVAEQENMSEIV